MEIYSKIPNMLLERNFFSASPIISGRSSSLAQVSAGDMKFSISNMQKIKDLHTHLPMLHDLPHAYDLSSVRPTDSSTHLKKTFVYGTSQPRNIFFFSFHIIQSIHPEESYNSVSYKSIHLLGLRPQENSHEISSTTSL